MIVCTIFFEVKDVHFSVHKMELERRKYYFTSFRLLQQVGGENVWSFGWIKTESDVTFIYRTSRESTCLVTFPCPKLVTSVHTRPSGRQYKVRKYKWNSRYNNGLRIVDYIPSCLYFSKKYICNFKLLSACLCIERNKEGK